MARSGLQITVDTKTPFNLQDNANSKGTKAGRPLLRKLVRFLDGVMNGAVNASAVTVVSEGAQPVAASVTATLASVLAADTFSINGVALTAVSGAPTAEQFDMSGTDIADATSLANDINNTTTNDLIRRHVEASNLAGSVTLASCTAGTKLMIGAHEFTAVAAANTTPQANAGDFDISGNDTADAAALVVAINTHPVLSHQVVASNSAGVVTIRQRRGTSALAVLIKSAVAGVTPSGLSITTQFAATAVVLVSAKNEGHTGNAITSASSNARITVSAARLAGGTGAESGTVSRIIIGASAN